MVTANDIRTVMAEIDVLDGKVDNIISPPLPFNRVAAFVPSVACSWIMPDMSRSDCTWSNGGADFWLCRLGFAVWMYNTNGDDASAGSTRLIDTGHGFGPSIYTSFFDFQWNMQRKTTQNQYGVPSNRSTDLLSHDSLGNLDINKPLTLEKPWRIPAGDALTFTMQPSMATDFAGRKVTVHILMDGFRTGVK